MLNRVNISVIILCGGMGTRLKSIYPHIPKALITVNGKPYLEWIIIFLKKQGIKNFIFATGHLSFLIKKWLLSLKLDSLKFIIKKEHKLLGTGGAIVNSIDDVSDLYLVINGDTLVLYEINQMIKLLDKSDLVILGIYQDNCSRYGSLEIDSDGYLIGFREKEQNCSGYINGGIYLFRKSIFSNIKKKMNLSFELDILPKFLIDGKKIMVYSPLNSPFLDIGTPESLKLADDFIKKHLYWFKD